MRRPLPLLIAGSVATAACLVPGLAHATGATGATGGAGGPGTAGRAADVVVRVAELVAAGEPTTAVVAGPAGSDLVGAPFEVTDAQGAVVARGTLVAPPETGRGRPVDPAPFGEVALAQLPGLDAGAHVVRAAGATDAVSVQASPYVPFTAGLLDLYDWNADGRESTVHAPSHLHDATATLANGPLRGTTVDLVGGWMDAGDQVKFTLTTAHATLLLELALYEAQDPALRSALQRQADVGMRWLRRAHPSPDLFVSLVGHVETDHDAGFRDPVSDDSSSTPRLAQRPAYAFTRRTGGADAAGMAATALALAAGRATGRAAARLVAAADDWLGLAQRLRRPWRNDYYPTETWLDDVAMAQLALASVRADRSLAAAGATSLEQALAPDGPDGEVRGWQVQVDGYDMGAVPAAMLCGVLAVGVETLVPPATSARGCDLLAAGVRDAEFQASRDAFGRPAAPTWGTNRQVGSAVAVALLADRAGDDTALDTARRGWGWFLGANPWGTRFQAGYGVAHPYHWSQVVTGDADGPQPVGAVVGGPAPVADLASVAGAPAYEPGPFDTDEVGWRDEPLDYVSNEVGLAYQSPWVLAGVLAAR